MNTQIKILIAEDNVSDVELLESELKRSGINYQSQVVETKEDYEHALKNFIPDIILSDFSFPTFNGHTAFGIRQLIAPDTPFIFVTGTIGEENSIEYIRSGVTDYVLKDNLKPLNTKIKRALTEAKANREYKAAVEEIKASEALYRSLFDNMMEGFAHCKMIYENGVAVDFIYLDVNSAFEKMTGLKNITGKKASEVLPGRNNDNPELLLTYSRVALTGKPERFEVYIKALKTWFDISVYSTEKGYFNAVSDEITEKKVAEQQKQFDKNNLDALINNTSDLMWSVDRNFNLITYNQPLAKIIKEVTGRELVAGVYMPSYAFNPEQANIYKMFYERAFTGEAFTETEYISSPVEVWSEISFYPIREGNKIIGSACHSRDISAVKKAEIENLKLANRLQLATDSAGIGIWDWDIENGVLNWDEGMYKLYQIDEFEFGSVYEGWLSRVHPDDRVQINEYIQNAIEGKEEYNTEFRIVWNDQSVHYIAATGIVIRDSAGNAIQMIGTNLDITKNKKAENHISRSEARLNEAQAIAHIANWEVDLTTGIDVWSNEFYKIFGIEPGDVEPSAEAFLSLLHPDDLDYAKAMVKNSFATHKDSKFDCRTRPVNGRIKYLHTESKFEFDKNNKAIRLYGIIQDITEQKKNEERLNLSASIINSSNDAIISKTLDGIITSWNHGAENILGYKAEEIIGKNISVLIPPHLLGEEKRILNEIRKGESVDHYETERIKKDGTVIYVSLTVSPIKDAMGHVIGASKILRDVTGEREAEKLINELNEKLQEANYELLAIVNTLPANIALVDTTGKIIVVNEAWNRFARENKMAGETFGLGENYIDVCGKVTGADLYIAHKMAEGLTSVLKGRLKEFSLPYACHSPDEKRWFNAEVRPLADREFSGAVVMHINITEQKLANNKIREMNEHLEERVQQRTAELSEANKALEAFSSTVSHDLRAPVKAIIGFSKRINTRYGESMDPKQKELFGYIAESGKRMSDIIEDLLKLAKYGNEKLNSEPVNMTELVNGVWINIDRTTNHHAILDLQELPTIEVDMSMMQQVVVNLLANAIKYSSKKEKPVVSVWCEQAKENATFYFKDNGAGFDMKNYDRLFGAFQRLHGASEFEGTGVGLTLVKRIIEKHGGTIGAEAKVGEGATFYFSLPVKA